MKEFVCTGCSLLCDDVAFEYSNNELKSFGLCRLGHNYLETALNQETAKEPENGAIEKAAELLLSAQNSLCYGWTSSTNETIREGLALTKTLGGFFDTLASLGLRRALKHSLHQNGFEIDFDEVRNRAEVVVFWGTNPAESSQRLISKFAVLPRGDKIPEGVESRTVAVIDVRRTETMKIANHQIILEPQSDTALADSIIGELSKTAPIKDAVGKVSAAELIGFTKNLQKSDCTIFFYGSGIVNSGNADSNLTGLSKIIQLLRESGNEAYAFPITTDCNSMGAIQVCQEITGFTGSVDFSSGKGEHDSQVTAYQKLLSGDIDAALIVGDDSVLSTPGPVAKVLAGLPIVFIGPRNKYTSKKATIALFSGENGIFSAGTMNRMDQKEMTLMPIDDISLTNPTEFNLISTLHESLKNKL